jgi:hypothetical protein
MKYMMVLTDRRGAEIRRYEVDATVRGAYVKVREKTFDRTTLRQTRASAHTGAAIRYHLEPLAEGTTNA